MLHVLMPHAATWHLRKSLEASSGCGTLADRLASISSGDSILFYSILFHSIIEVVEIGHPRGDSGMYHVVAC